MLALRSSSTAALLYVKTDSICKIHPLEFPKDALITYIQNAKHIMREKGKEVGRKSGDCSILDINLERMTLSHRYHFDQFLICICINISKSNLNSIATP